MDAIGMAPGQLKLHQGQISGRRPAGSPKLKAGPAHHAAKSAVIWPVRRVPRGPDRAWQNLNTATHLSTSQPHASPDPIVKKLLSELIHRSLRMSLITIKTLSTVIGWTYMLCWTASFYPQFFLNIRRRTTTGFSIDFAFLNILGMASYAVHNLVLFFSPVVRAQYAHRYPRNPIPTVQPNDIAYAVHGALIAVLIYSQFYPRLWRFAPIKNIRCSRWSLGFFWGCVGAVMLGALVVGLQPTSFRWEWLDVVSA